MFKYLDQDLRIERVPAVATGSPVPGRRHPGRPHVVAVVHGRDPEHLAAVLAAVAAQTVRPDVLVGVDSGADDEAGKQVSDMLRAHADEVLRLAPSATLADAVTAVLVHRGTAGLHPGADVADGVGSADGAANAGTNDWVWVLDDRDRPSTMRALERLVDRVRRSDNRPRGRRQAPWRPRRRGAPRRRPDHHARRPAADPGRRR